jgi:enoyl-CoA hydratase/carnithine racemase
MSVDDLVTYTREGGIVYLRLNRPDKLNAISDDAVEAMKARLAQFDADEQAAVAILHGAGRAFSSGADVVQRQLRPVSELKRYGGPQAKRNYAAHIFYDAVNWKPIISACHGYVFGAALGWVLSTDLVVAGSDTKFQITEVSRGLAGARVWSLLAMRTGYGFADEVGITGRVFDAQEAARYGLVNRLTEPGGHLAAAKEYAEMILKNPPLATRLMVRARRLAAEEADRRWTIFAQPFQLHLTSDFRRSAQAFVDKEEAEFTGG